MIWSLRGLRWSYGAFIAWSSLQTFLTARAGHDIVPLVLSSVELVAIAAFLSRRLEFPACVVLTGVYVVAAVLTALAGQMPIRFAYYTATAICIVVVGRSAGVVAQAAD